MAILFDWYENPVSPDQPKKKRFHPRIAYNGQVDTDEMRSKIQSRCTLNEVDVTAVLDALSQVMGEELGEGRQVHLDGIGYFYPTLTATEEIAADTPRRNMKIKLKAIRSRSEQKLKTTIGLIKVKHLKKNFHSPNVPEEVFQYASDDAAQRFSVFVRHGTFYGYDSYPEDLPGRKVAEYRIA